MPRAESWLDRYRAGERDNVWHELRQAGDRVRAPELVRDAQDVCDEMARRARRNIETIIERLTDQGYVFHTNDDKRTPVTPHFPPGPRAAEVSEWLTSRFDAVPMTLLSWLRLVGDVWLVGTHPDWQESSAGDPLVIEVEGARYPEDSITDYYDDEWVAYQEMTGDETAGRFELPAAPDRLHKDNTSGGAPYAFIIPDGCADALFVAETTTPFVAYLRSVFSQGGFPAATGSRHELRIKRSLAEDLLPL